MSFKTKTILLFILVSLSPYAITMAILGSVYRSNVEARLLDDMAAQLDVTIARLDQSLQTLENDMAFMASLDVMNDILSGDIDRRIFNMLLQKKQDLALSGDFHVVDRDGKVVASTKVAAIGQFWAGTAFHSVELHSTFDDSPIGELLVEYENDNLTRYFGTDAHLRYSLRDAASLEAPAENSATLQISKPLQKRPALLVSMEQDRQFAFAALDTLNRSFIVALSIGAVLIGSIALLAANHMLRPILLLAATAREVTQTHDYSRQASVERSDEIGQLAMAFNSMISGMQAMIARVKEEGENRLKLVQEKNRAEMLQNLSNKLARYLSPQIYESIFSGEKDVTLSSSRKKLTIFFSDIVGFTSTTDQMESEDLTLLLNQYLREMTDIALRYGATIDKYIGDAIMIFFGDPHSQGVAEDARLCVEMAIAMQKRVQELQGEWRAAGYTKPFSIRIGIHTGYCTVGNFGTESRMDYTIVGSAVNLASRIENAAEPGSIYLSEETWLLVHERFACIPAATVTPKGLSQALQLYRVEWAAPAAARVALDLGSIHVDYDPQQLDDETRLQLGALIDKLKGRQKS